MKEVLSQPCKIEKQKLNPAEFTLASKLWCFDCNAKFSIGSDCYNTTAKFACTRMTPKKTEAYPHLTWPVVSRETLSPLRHQNEHLQRSACCLVKPQPRPDTPFWSWNSDTAISVTFQNQQPDKHAYLMQWLAQMCRGENVCGILISF